MFLSAMSVLVVAQSNSEIPEGLMNNPVLRHELCEWKATTSILRLFHYCNAQVQ